MLFNSPEFIFSFLPITLAGFFVLGRFSRGLAFGWLVLASLFFYAWWNPLNVPIIGVSLVVNYVFARLIERLGAAPDRKRARLALLIAGVAFNVLFLGYFKYFNFIESSLNDLAGTDFVVVHIVLPLGISFITFQKIAFLIDVYGERVERFSAGEFLLFVMFFPQLIAGPIVHFREMMPQFRSHAVRFDGTAAAAGLTLFSIGLFKKVVLADGVAAYVSPLYEQAATGAAMSLFPAWAAAVGFTLQIYFDFSGYSDMALGIARCFGVRLPLNFDSPLKATSIIDFWLRWHVTLTRFLTAYIYNPLVLALTRRRATKGGALRGGPSSSVGAFVGLLAGPTLVTMLVSGVWHGAGWLFMLWGLVHGAFLVINHAWRILIRKIWTDKQSYTRVMGPIGFVLTFVAVTMAMVLFRSTTGVAASGLLVGMLGGNGISLPRGLLEPLGLIDVLPFVVAEDGGAVDFVLTWLWVGGLFLIATALPNSLQLMARYEPALDPGKRVGPTVPARFAWRPSLSWAFTICVVAATAILRLSAESEFLYWQF
jgi:D-alanyl-lipoteichoic acid acyltransferase DltB (MBOAT superfamily)